MQVFTPFMTLLLLRLVRFHYIQADSNFNSPVPIILFISEVFRTYITLQIFKEVKVLSSVLLYALIHSC